jgi:hypothetical protein
MDELIDSIKQTIGERLSSPLLSSFIFSWCLWNWKFLVILFSDADVSVTFALIDKYSFPERYDYYLHGLLYPLGSAGLFVFGYPYIEIIVYGFRLQRQKIADDLKKRIAGKELLDIDESKAVSDRALALNEKLNIELAKWKATVQNLTIERDKALDQYLSIVSKTDNQDTINNIDKLAGQLSNSQFKLLETIGAYGGECSYYQLIKNEPESKISIDYEIEELRVLNLLAIHGTDSNKKITLTHDGRGVILSLSKPPF